jgi:hypothetical protein
LAENVILLQRSGPVHWQRQVAACAAYFNENDYALVGKAESHADAMQMVFNGIAKVVVAAWPAGDDWRLGRLLDEIGGRFEICRQSPTGPDRLGVDTSGVIRYLSRRDQPTEEIASFLKVSVNRVMRALRRPRE